jgi:hypothetical protein
VSGQRPYSAAADRMIFSPASSNGLLRGVLNKLERLCQRVLPVGVICFVFLAHQAFAQHWDLDENGRFVGDIPREISRFIDQNQRLVRWPQSDARLSDKVCIQVGNVHLQGLSAWLKFGRTEKLMVLDGLSLYFWVPERRPFENPSVSNLFGPQPRELGRPPPKHDSFIAWLFGADFIENMDVSKVLRNISVDSYQSLIGWLTSTTIKTSWREIKSGELLNGTKLRRFQSTTPEINPSQINVIHMGDDDYVYFWGQSDFKNTGYPHGIAEFRVRRKGIYIHRFYYPMNHFDRMLQDIEWMVDLINGMRVKDCGSLTK